jgi:hypothetical protein
MMEKADLARDPPLGAGKLLGRGGADMKILVRREEWAVSRMMASQWSVE